MRTPVNTEPGATPAAPKPARTQAPDRQETTAERAIEFGLRFVMVWVLIILAIVSDFLYPGFFDSGNILNILSQNAPVGLIAVAMTFVIIAGGFDLSVAAMLAAGGVAFASFSNHIPIGLAAIATIALGAVAGSVNGFIVTKMRVNPFIATLGTASLYAGGTALYCHSNPINGDNPNFDFLGTSKWFGVPISVWVLGVVLVIGWVVLTKTVYGRTVYAVGGNNEAAKLAGMRVDLVRASTFVLTGVASVISGMIVASVTGTALAGVEAEVTLNSIAIVIIGGTSLLGGEGAMWRTLVGLLIFGTINNLFDSLAWPTATQQVVLGAIVLGAVSLDAYTRSRRRTGG
ncbi:MAG TPA: ABC transporter permease [Baekduia sp.]|jgi:ribose transport system permease protein|nr:ABC transporter permease [Baekduia sp.]